MENYVFLLQLFLFTTLVIPGIFDRSSQAIAQITPDNTLNSTVTAEGTLQRITNGTTAGNNLFHSFSEFNILTGETAFFDNATTIENIITRVTGGNISNLDGILRANGSANFFLINPGGIIFGENAQLEIGGSFVGTTAESFVFDDGITFSANDVETTPLLSVNVPMGLQYGSSSNPLEIQGTTLQLEMGQTLTLAGGNIEMTGGQLQVPNGRISLGSATGGTLALDEGLGIAVDSGITSGGNINLSQQSSLIVTDISEGIDITTDRLNVIEESSISTAGKVGNTGNVRITARSEFFFNNSNISTNIEELGMGQAGDINITAASLSLVNSAKLTTQLRSGIGRGGQITILADTVSLDRGFIRSETRGNKNNRAQGDAGDINIQTKILTLVNSQISSDSRDADGNAGVMNVEADIIDLSGLVFSEDGIRTGLFASVISNAVGEGGDILVNTDELIIRDGATLSASNFQSGNLTAAGQGPAGNIEINANSVLLSNDGLITTAAVIGDQGNIVINADHIQLRQGSTITTNAIEDATGGNITLNAETLVGLENSDITANAETTRGGEIQITVDNIFGLGILTLEELEELVDEVSLDSPRQLSSSDITAISEAGSQLSGTVTIVSPEVDTSAGLIELSTIIIDPSQKIVTGCGAAEGSSFMVVGSGGLPENPSSIIRGQTVVTDWRDFSQQTITNSFPQSPPFAPSLYSPIIEATGWKINGQGIVELVAYQIEEDYRSSLRAIQCHD